MKYLKIISVTVSLFTITNAVIAGNQRTLANPDVKVEVRSTEDIVSNPSDFVSINLSDNARKMSSKSLRVKNKTVEDKKKSFVQSQSNKKDVVQKYNRHSDIKGEKKSKK